jgi:prepilin-type N-terminal cleavage/methylation domain-containing protein
MKKLCRTWSEIGGENSSGAWARSVIIRPSSAAPPGFTLLEIMLAVAIFAGVMMAIHSCWSAILRGSKAGIDAAAEAQRKRVAVRSLEESLGSAQFFAQNPHYYALLTDTSGEFAAISLVARLSASFPGSGLFESQPVRRISFSVESSNQARNQLLMRQQSLLDPPDASTEPYVIVLGENVNLFELEFFDGRALEWLPEWNDTNQIPKLIRFSLGFGEPRQLERLISRVVSLPNTPVVTPR